MQIKYETDQKEKDIKLLTKSNQIKDNIARQANTSRNVALGGSAAVVLFMVLFYYNYRLKQKTNNEIREKNDALNQLVKDKEWLIKEIHHRVKNNLQIVIGLLQRQSSFVDNAEALAIIQNSEHRMQSIALIHQKLYQSDDLALIDMADYIDGFVSYLKEYLDPQSRIIFLREVDAIQLDVAQAVPVGLILNEAITNSIKYAFPEDGYGTINITLTETCENSYLLIIADNGWGLKPGFNIEECHSLGMKLIKGLSKQLNGKLQIISEKGLCLKISFKTDAVLMGG
ncbi:sensor histidine kinase [Mucilaginibacter sp. P25]|uniref:sensor histidine kinase n=1 Tax=unclassified Mucilaginibacter TaxID=2617802 RepID=UPI003D67EDE4